ncbi:MAG: hypothetical protein HY402_05445 [Elusimicrobia bacterium]|nr:hypothetical protein [Elusimicrobiota bacterium]
MPLDTSKIEQLVVQFACRTPTRKDLTAAERKALENTLKGTDEKQELFQLFSEEPSQKSPNLFQAARQYNFDAITLTVPSFAFSTDSATLLYPVKLGKKIFTRDQSLETKDLNKRMVQILFEVQNTIKGLRYLRAGKIFELVLGSFSPDDKKRIFQGFISYDMADIGELNLTYAKYVKHGDKFFNIQTTVKFNQLQLTDPFPLAIRVDINNRQLAESLDPSEIERVWSRADEIIWEHLESTITI